MADLVSRLPVARLSLVAGECAPSGSCRSMLL
jgi:hypothetical protein